MTRVQYYCAASLDGYIADADDGLDWLTGYRGSYDGDDAEPGPLTDGGPYERFYDQVGALVSGSKTYEFLLDHLAEGGAWPYSGKPYWVLSSREPAPVEGEDVRVIAGSVGDLYEQMAASASGRSLWVVGGGNVASQFADAGLLDELLLTVVPVILGAGKPIFERALPGAPLQLTGSRSFETGMVELSYELKS